MGGLVLFLPREVAMAGDEACWLYILWSESAQRYYVGQTTDVEQRLAAHNSGRSRWSKRGVPWQLVFKKECADRSGARRLESFIKRQKSRRFIEDVIAGLVALPDPD